MQTIGERLEEARKKKGMTIREAADATKIRGDYLQKFEGNQFDIGLADIYVRGFLRNYAAFLHLAPDRIIADLDAVGRADARPRKPSREVYGRMDLSLAAAESEGEGQPAASPEQPAAAKPAQTRFSKAGSNLPKSPAIDPATVVKLVKWGSIGVGGLVGLIVISHFVGGSEQKARPAGIPDTAAQATAGLSPFSDPAAPAPTLTLTASDDVRVKIVRKSDGTQLFQGILKRGDRQEYPNVPLLVTADTLEKVQIEYKGKPYVIERSGYGRVTVDMSKAL